MLKSIKDIIYIKKIIPSSSEYFRLEIQNDENILKYIDSKYERPKINKIKDKEVIEYLDSLFRIIDSWKQKYIKNNALDGIEWQLQIKYKNAYSKYYSGKNDFPINFEALDRIKYEIIEKSLEKNS